MSVTDTLKERSRYGSFETHSMLAQLLKSGMTAHANYSLMSPDIRESLEMIQHKIARIINGDPDYIDNWHDIQGYAKLIEDRLTKEQTPIIDANKRNASTSICSEPVVSDVDCTVSAPNKDNLGESCDCSNSLPSVSSPELCLNCFGTLPVKGQSDCEHKRSAVNPEICVFCGAHMPGEILTDKAIDDGIPF